MNVMLVDDYALILRGIMKVYQWNENGFPIVATASNGKLALEQLQKQSVDILMTDIRMPVMDGLELISAVKEKYPHIKIAVLSAYDDFVQVRNAFQLGADDYLLKQELSAQLVGTVLNRLKSAIEIEKGKSELEGKLGDLKQLEIDKENEEGEDFIYRQTNFFKNLLEDNSKYDESSAKSLGITVNASIALMQLVLESSELGENTELAVFSVEQKLREAAKKHNAYIFRTNYNEFNFLYSVLKEDDLKTNAKRLFDTIQVVLSPFNAMMTAAVSSIGGSLAEMAQVYSQARQVCGFRFLIGKGKLLFFDDMPLEKSMLDPEIRSRVTFLRNSLKGRDYKGLLESLCEITVPEDGGGLSQQQIELLFTRYAFTIVSSIEDQNLSINCDKLLITFQFLLSGDSIAELNEWIRDALNQMASQCESQNKYILLFQSYIKQNYTNRDLKIENLANELGISVSYMGQLLYRETGCHFAEYLNSYRVERAKEILSKTTQKVYEVADKIGYNNVEHFTRVFKKYVGVSPTSYANRG